MQVNKNLELPINTFSNVETVSNLLFKPATVNKAAS